MSSKAPTSVSANEAKPNMKPNVKPNVKPVGKTSTKPAPVVSKVSPVKGAKPVGPSSNRAAASSNVNTARPEKATNNRAAASSAVNTSKAEKATNNRTYTNGEKGEVSESTMNTEIKTKKPDADYCKGWKLSLIHI